MSNIEETSAAETTIKQSNIEETSNTNTEATTQAITNAEGQTLETTTTATTQATTKTGMSIPFIGLSIIQCIIAFLIIVVVLQQSKTATPMASNALSGAAAETDSYWNKNKGRSKEGKLAKMTVILAVIFFSITFILGFIK